MKMKVLKDPAKFSSTRQCELCLKEFKVSMKENVEVSYYKKPSKTITTSDTHWSYTNYRDENYVVLFRKVHTKCPHCGYCDKNDKSTILFFIPTGLEMIDSVRNCKLHDH